MKQHNLKNLSCWLVCESDLIGTENQCIAVAEALGVNALKRYITLREPWRSLTPWLGFENSFMFAHKDHGVEPPWPDLVIAAGRKSIAASRFIKRQSKGQSFTVQLQDPRIDLRYFDLVAVPQHDPARGENVIVTDGAPNRITAKRLDAAKESFSEFAASASPRIAVLIGGSSKAYRLTPAITRKLSEQLRTIHGSLMITPSRRTGDENEAILRDALPNAYIWDGKGENPYFAMLAHADYILVTADSASMISDACSTGKPVYMIPLEGGHPRINKLHNHLIEKGVLKVFEGNLETYTYEPLHDAVKIANAIKERMKL